MQDPTIKSEASKSEAPKSVSSTSQNTGAPTTSASSNSKPDGAASSNPKSETPKSESTKSASPTSQSTSAPSASTSSSSKPDGAASSTPKSNTTSTSPSNADGDHHDLHARTRHRAYLNFLDRQKNSHHGDEHSDWLRAEQQIREEHERNQAPQSKSPTSGDGHQAQGVRKDDAYKSAKA